jgi:hypothetical protein
MRGVRTNIVTAVEIHDKDASDTKLLPDLVDATAAHFRMREVSADKGYSSVNNLAVIAARAAVPYIAFKSIHTGPAAASGRNVSLFPISAGGVPEPLSSAATFVESTFSMIKAKFRYHVRSKTDIAMKNEVLCKIVCHNICCLIQETHELGITTEFWEDQDVESKSGLDAKQACQTNG